MTRTEAAPNPPSALEEQEREQAALLAIAEKQSGPIGYLELGSLFDKQTSSEKIDERLPSAACRRAFWNLVDQGILAFTSDRKIILAPTVKP